RTGDTSLDRAAVGQDQPVEAEPLAAQLDVAGLEIDPGRVRAHDFDPPPAQLGQPWAADLLAGGHLVQPQAWHQRAVRIDERDLRALARLPAQPDRRQGPGVAAADDDDSRSLSGHTARTPDPSAV